MPAVNPPESALYRTIHNQPAVLQAVLQREAGGAAEAARLIADARRVLLSGTGTSSHAAIIGEHLFRLAGSDGYATTNFDLACYPRPLGAGDALIAISHRGSKRYGKQVIEQALATGARVIGITGQDSAMSGPAVVLHTAPQEVSSAHTASYTGNLAALAMIAVALGEHRGLDIAALRDGLDALPGAVTAILAAEEKIVPAATALAARGRLTLVGAGPNAATAREGALKVKETSYLVAEGFELETVLHGGLQAIEAGDVVAVIAAHGPALSRTGDLVRALRLIGARLLLIAGERASGALQSITAGYEAVDLVTYPAVPEPLSPILAAVPLQLLAAFTAALRGTDADGFRADDPVYKGANASYML